MTNASRTVWTTCGWVLVGGVMMAQAQVVTRVSVTGTGGEGNSRSTAPAVSADGRFVAFESIASNLVPSDTNGSYDIFVKDRQTGAITRVSVKSDGTEAIGDSHHPAISADGRIVAFVSTAALVAEDTNATECNGFPAQPTCADIYVHDRTTGITSRVSVASDGTQATNRSDYPAVSGDGRYVVFGSLASLTSDPILPPSRVYLRDRVTNTTTLASVSGSGSPVASYVSSISTDGSLIAYVADALYLRNTVAGTIQRIPFVETLHVTDRAPDFAGAIMSADGSTVAVQAGTVTTEVPGRGPFAPPTLRTRANLVLYTIADGRVRLVDSMNELQVQFPASGFDGLSISGTGRVVAYCRPLPRLVDTVTGLARFATSNPDSTFPSWCTGTALTGDGNALLFASEHGVFVSDDHNFVEDVFALDRDADHDGMSGEWETAFALDPASAADAAADADGDGKTNLQEFQAGTHPKGMFTRYLAEGARNAFFSTAVHLYNPGTSGAAAIIRYLGESGEVKPTVATLAAKSAITLTPATLDASFSTVVESDVVVAVERTMTWASGGVGAGYGSSAETGIASPATMWYFAEGTTGRFTLFYLLQNPNAASATVTITYLLPGGQTPIVRAYALGANSRRTIFVNEEPGLEGTDVSATIDSDQPIFAERAIYLSRGGEAFAAGTAGAGIPAPATKWFIAEGATGGFFDLYILIGNPSPTDANVTVTYLLPDGTSFAKTYAVSKQSRLTIGVDGEDARLANTSVSAVITSTNTIPIVVERAMWWPSPDWYEGSLTTATTETGTRWALAGGYVSSTPEDETYVLVANPSDTAANVTFTLSAMPAAPIPPTPTPSPTACGTPLTIAIPAHSRHTLPVKTLCGSVATVPSYVFGTITSNGPEIVAERATYWSTSGQFWSAGASTLLTRLP